MNIPAPPKLLGMTTLNDKGQIVIPKIARDKLGLSPGDQVVMLQAPFFNAVVIAKPEEVEKYLGMFSHNIKKSMDSLQEKTKKRK